MFYRDNKLVFELPVENLTKGLNINLVINKKPKTVISVLDLIKIYNYYILTTFAACSLRSPSTISNSTLWPSSKDLYPSSTIAEKCTNTSPPFSLSMKPKPFLH